MRPAACLSRLLSPAAARQCRCLLPLALLGLAMPAWAGVMPPPERIPMQGQIPVEGKRAPDMQEHVLPAHVLLAQDSQDAAASDPAPSPESPDFIAFWKAFTQAAQADDRAALQAMTHLPFDLNGDSYEAAQFDTVHQEIYDAKARQCLAAGKPVADQENFDVTCGARIYIFGTEPTLAPDAAQAPDGSGWRLLEIDEND